MFPNLAEPVADAQLCCVRAPAHRHVAPRRPRSKLFTRQRLHCPKGSSQIRRSRIQVTAGAAALTRTRWSRSLGDLHDPSAARSPSSRARSPLGVLAEVPTPTTVTAIQDTGATTPRSTYNYLALPTCCAWPAFFSQFAWSLFFLNAIKRNQAQLYTRSEPLVNKLFFLKAQVQRPADFAVFKKARGTFAAKPPLSKKTHARSIWCFGRPFLTRLF